MIKTRTNAYKNRNLPLFLLLISFSPVTWTTYGDDLPGLSEATVEEVFLGDLLFPQEKGELQLTFGAAIGETLTSVVAGLEWGLTDAWQVELEVESLLNGNHPGVSRLELGGRYSAMNARPNLHLAAGLSLAFSPDATDTTPRHATSVESVVILGRDLAHGKLHLFTQLGAEWAINEGDLEPGVEAPEDEFEWVAGGFGQTPWGAATLEVGVDREFRGEQEREWRLAVGWVFDLKKWQLGFGHVFQMEDGEPDIWLVTWTFEPEW